MRNALTSLQHPLVKHFVKLRVDPAYRSLHQTLLIEGLKPIQELSPFVVRVLYTPSYTSVVLRISGEKWEVTEAMVHKISALSSPEGIVAEVRMPSFIPLGAVSRVLALDGVSDPGNMGVLLRTALALGWQQVYLLPGCCDPFNEKVLRTARGAHFRLALSKGSVDALHRWVKAEKVQALVADLRGTPPDQVTVADRRLLVLGNEAHGASEVIGHFCAPVAIPMPGDMESLNVAVAGGILLYLLMETSSL